MSDRSLVQLPKDFYTRYWQQKPLLIRQAIVDFESPISADELAGLACEEQIESRIVIEDDENSKWKVKHGPFDESTFANLPKQKWTLLVQAVDHWVSEVHALRRQFQCVPNWRFDDVMVSYAADQGSVGPHYDQYDVFLLQGLGQRLWKIGPKYDANAELEENSELQLVKDFHSEEQFLLQPGDVLYVPPGYGHWGIAQGECMTYSVGFRAPAYAELLPEYSAYVAERCSKSLRYEDIDRERLATISHGEISSEVIDHLYEEISKKLTKEVFEEWFGRYISEPKYDISPDNELLNMQENDTLVPAPSSRFAYIRQQEQLNLFVDGEKFRCSLEDNALIYSLCDGKSLNYKDYQKLGQTQRELVSKLFRQGSLLIAE